MHPTPESQRSLRRSCLLALHMAALAGTAYAQSTPAAQASDDPVVLDAFVVNSVRTSLESAQETKQNSLVLVDSIVAQDIGKFPDNTVADALQHVPGIQVGRNNGEVNSVIIRGLPNLGTTLNGDEVFTGTSRGVALQDIPAELVAGVDVFKSPNADQIEGGIAGLINIRLFRPFDFSKTKFTAGFRAGRGEEAGKTGMVGSALASQTWKSGADKKVGVLVGGSYQRHHYKDQRVFNFLFEPVDSQGKATGAVEMPFTAGSLLIPGDRKRTALNTSLQFKVNSNLEVYADFLRMDYRNLYDVHFFIGLPRFGGFDNITLYPGTQVVNKLESSNNFHLTSTQAFTQKTAGYKATTGAIWRKDQFKVTSEVAYDRSQFKNRVVIVDTQYVAPSKFSFNFNQNGGTNVSITGGDITDANNFRLWGLFDNNNYDKSDQVAWRTDAEYKLPKGVLTAINGGFRVSARDAESRATSRNDIAPADGRGTRNTATITGFGSKAPEGLFGKGDFGAANWYGADPDYLRNNTDALRALFGLPAGDAPYNPAVAFTDKEKVYAGYVQAKYSIPVGQRSIDGYVGTRLVRTEQTLVGNRTDGTPVNGKNSTNDLLPSFGARFRIQDDLLMRFTMGRSITRPNFADLNPVVNLNAPTTTGGGAGTGGGGNPDLKPVTSDNFDLSLEKYFSKSSYVSVAGFHRVIDGYVQSFASTETINNVQYNVVRPRNSGKGHLQGVEVAYQKILEKGPLEGLGMQANYTYIVGKDTVADTGVKHDYAQVSKHSYNIIGIFERGPMSFRLAYNWRGKFIETFDGPNAPGNPLRIISVDPTQRVDFSMSYNVNEHLTLTFDVANLLKNGRKDHFGSDGYHPRDNVRYDRVWELGARYRF